MNSATQHIRNSYVESPNFELKGPVLSFNTLHVVNSALNIRLRGLARLSGAPDQPVLIKSSYASVCEMHFFLADFACPFLNER